jgi:hypothetical protein
MLMRLGSIVVLAAALVLVRGAGASAADPCVGDAKLELLDCKADCKEGLQLAKDNCKNRDHGCMEECRAVRADCRLQTGIDAALAQCRNDLHVAKQACRDAHPNDPEGTDECIDQVQVVAYLCRRAARREAKPALAVCRSAFRECARGCQLPPGEPIDTVQCKIDAVVAYKLCKATCREAFQTQKDLCLGRDHACVEVCRADRDACRQPIEATLDAAIASCNTTRNDAVDDCKVAYGEGTPEREACIVNALVDAFQCRDAAREAARPGFAGCRTAFVDCAEGCALAP